MTQAGNNGFHRHNLGPASVSIDKMKQRSVYVHQELGG
jgi:hypothetical protein